MTILFLQMNYAIKWGYKILYYKVLQLLNITKYKKN